MGGGSTGGAGGISALACWVGDFDGDGVLDCAKPGPGTADLSFYKGQGAGLYSTTGVVTAGALPTGYALVVSPFDMDADGRADIVVQAPDPDVQAGLIDFVVLRGQASGTFAFVAPSAQNSPSARIQTVTPVKVGVPGDFDGNGKTDLFVPWQKPGGVGGGTTPELYWGVLYLDDGETPRIANTDAGFTLGSTGNVGPMFSGAGPIAATGDATGDGNLDGFVILHFQTLAGSSSNQFVAFAIGNGDLTFQPGTATTKDEVPGTDGATSVQTGDYNNDGKLDLLVGLPAGPTTFYGDGAGNFSVTAP